MPKVECTINVTSVEQPDGTSISSSQVDRGQNLIVKGTADPNASQVTAKMTVGLSMYDEMVSYSGMNWTCTVDHNHFGTAPGASIQFKNACDGGLPVFSMLPIMFKN